MNSTEDITKVKKRVANEINRIVNIEATKQGLTPFEIINNNKDIIENLKKKLAKKARSIQSAMRKELERERVERQKFVQASRENKIFSDDFIQKREEVYHLVRYWTYEEEQYLLVLKQKGVAIKDIAYLLDRNMMDVSFKLTELKNK